MNIHDKKTTILAELKVAGTTVKELAELVLQITASILLVLSPTKIYNSLGDTVKS